MVRLVKNTCKGKQLKPHQLQKSLIAKWDLIERKSKGERWNEKLRRGSVQGYENRDKEFEENARRKMKEKKEMKN